MVIIITRFSCRIGRRADKQGPRSPVGDQAGIEKYATGTNSTQNALEDHHTEDIPHVAPPQNSTKASRQKWSREEYKEVMEAFYTASLNPKISVIQGTYDIWRASNPTNRMNLDANKLANVRRDQYPQ